MFIVKKKKQKTTFFKPKNPGIRKKIKVICNSTVQT